MTAPSALHQAADVLARTAGAISANPYVGGKLAEALNGEGLLAGGAPTTPVRDGAIAVLTAHGQTPDAATRAVNRLAEAGLLAEDGPHD